MKQKNENASRPGGAGRKPKADPAVFRYSISFNAIDHARFLALFDQSGLCARKHIYHRPHLRRTVQGDKNRQGGSRILYPADRFIFPVQGHRREL